MKKLLIVVDYQVDFVDGALGFPGAEKLEPIIYEKIKTYKANGDDVIFTFDTHDENYLSTVEGKKLPVVHCIKGSIGHRLYGRLNEFLNDSMSFEKVTFGSLELGFYLKDKEYSEIEVCGLVSNICVISNAIIAKSALPNAIIKVDAKATASFNADLHNKVLDVLDGLHIDVINR